MIVNKTQGDPVSDRYIFGTIGPWLTMAKLHEHLGMAITSEIGDVWFIETEADNKFRGFALVRKLKTGNAAHLRYLFATESADPLVGEVLQWASSEKLRTIHTNDRIENPVWKKHGFSAGALRRGGHFVRWELMLEKADD